MVSSTKKPSVRETLKRIKNELKTKELRKEEKEDLNNGKDVTIIDGVKRKTTEYVNTDKGIKKTTTKWSKGKER